MIAGHVAVFPKLREPEISHTTVLQKHIRLGGVVVSVFATRSKGLGFDPGQGDGFLRTIKIRSTPSFGWEAKVEVPFRKIDTIIPRSTLQSPGS
jgi:hypothetical protein